MKKKHCFTHCAIWIAAILIMSCSSPRVEGQATGNIGVEITTAEVKQLLLAGKIPVIDVRPEEEYKMSHIPGAIHIFETEIDRMIDVCKSNGGAVIYCNGPNCHKVQRVRERMSQKEGCADIRIFQDGMPIWRALGNTVEITLTGFMRVFSLDKTAVLIDARSEEEYKAGSIPGAVSLKAEDIEAANEDGRLPYTDHGTRIIVFGSDANQARQLAEAIGLRAYWNSGYLGSTYDELRQAVSGQ